jgi:hypothetical protein
MKNIFLALIAFASLSCINACNEKQNDEDKVLAGKLSTDLVNNPISLENQNPTLLNTLGQLKFKDSLHDFKTIHEGEKVSTEFEFVNIGKKAVIISEAKASCGCTTPIYKKTPIQPNEKGSIQVTFDSEGKTGYNDKAIGVTTNANPPCYFLTIRANVVK